MSKEAQASTKRVVLTGGAVLLLALIGNDLRVLLVGVPAAIAVGLTALADARRT